MVVPYGIVAVIVLLIIFIFYYRIERLKHEKNAKSIPIRIWVNGSRGKSSVTRLIAAGLRAQGKKVIAKTTGTEPRLINDNNQENRIIRLGLPNIREQIRVFNLAAAERPDAIVLECMALRPDLQKIESMQIVHPTAVVITNVRPDHLDVMGPSTKDITKTFVNAIPENCILFTNEQILPDNLPHKLNKNNTKIFQTDTAQVSDTVMRKFPYIEHKENVGLALAVCKHFGANEATALKAMQNVTPDPGALQQHEINLSGKRVTLLNAMAANDPESTQRIWQIINKEYPEINILINCRDDRIDRSLQFAGLIKEHLLNADHFILTGSGTDILAGKLSKVINKNKIFNLGNKKPGPVIGEISNIVANKSLLFAIGNTVGYGIELIKEFLAQREK
jgi:poly-gamma-glutamate synthase PgsB/CapB